MMSFLEQLVASLGNRLRRRRSGTWSEGGTLDLGAKVSDGETTGRHRSLSDTRRTLHMAVLGKTGSGKSFFLGHLAEQDIEAGRGFLHFDFHGDATARLVRKINAEERKHRRHLDSKLILIDPTDPIVSIGFNPLEMPSPDFMRIAEVTALLKRRWGLDHFGARTEELLRNSLFALAANRLTLVELSLFLSNGAFRQTCLKQVANGEVREYFKDRYDTTSEPMRATMREPILNKTSSFTADPRFRHIVGQVTSTFSLLEAMDRGMWVIVNLEKGKLGEQAPTLGSLILSVVKNALFARKTRTLFSLYCDEIQNLVAYGSGIETLLSEARKFGVGVITANQFLDQYPPEVRAAILSVGTQVFFQLTGQDAAQIANVLDGGRSLAERLKNLPQRHCIVKTGSERFEEIRVPYVHELSVDPTDLVNRVRYTKGRVRAHVERDIEARQAGFMKKANEVLDGWE